MNQLQSRGIASVVLSSVLIVGGCSFSVGSMEIPKEELEQKSLEALTEEVGQRPAKVECPEAIKAESGQTTRCVLTAKGGGRVGYTVTVESYENGRYQVDIQVDETPMRSVPEGAGR
ncbi:DUF4333 domain-containing protein [Saccharomonospora iraqiensis]|uniref:DUF4333 domain-containing protein n=1 Tax=Saccharomonospora iraqiensis TaxID=52698 RepID=UPI000A00E233|nr:DUF4333 domain-containing protein [Saccharomonospora iraqiensis]